MNRIYQGRVTKVEKLKDGKRGRSPDDWEPLENWPTALWRHHELFQDAVNYYTLALAAMAEGLKPSDEKAREREKENLEREWGALKEQSKKAKKDKNEVAKEIISKREKEIKDRIEQLEREDAVWQWREKVRDAWENGVERGAQRFDWPKETITQILKKLNPEFDAVKANFDECSTQILALSKAAPALRAEALLYLLELAGSKSDLSPLSQDKLPWLCNYSSENLTDDVAKSKNRRNAQIAVIRIINDEMKPKDLDPGLFVQKSKAVQGTAAREGLLDVFDLAVKFQKHPKKGRDFTQSAKLESLRDDFEKYIQTLSSNFSINLAEKRGQKEFPFAVLMKVWPDQPAVVESFKIITKSLAGKPIEKSNFEEIVSDSDKLFSALVEKQYIDKKGSIQKRLAELEEESAFDSGGSYNREKSRIFSVLQKSLVKIVDKDLLKNARKDQDKPHFDYFTNLAFDQSAQVDTEEVTSDEVEGNNDEGEENDGTGGRAVWIEFDFAAFVEAIKSPHRYYQDTLGRKESCRKLKERIAKIEKGKGEKEQVDEGGESTERLHGFTGDYRIEGKDEKNKGVKQLVKDHELLAYLEEDEADDDGAEYGINENTLRGWSELRRKWREVAAKPEFHNNPEALKAELNSIRRKQQGDRPEEAGGGGLFKRLQEPEYRCIWRDDPPDPEVHAEDPLWAWVRLRELKDELKKTSEPIRYAPAHPIESPRFFIFPKQNRKKETAPKRGKEAVGMKSDHVPGLFAYNDSGKLVAVSGDESWLKEKDCPRFMAFNAGLVVNEKPLPVRIYFSAPRLRRDDVRSDSEQQLGSTPYLQPMVEALGVAPDVPEINFANCRITLLAEREERPNERALDEPKEEQAKSDKYVLNLGFPVAVETNKLQKHKLFGHGHCWNRRELSKEGKKFVVHDQFNFSGGDDLHEISLRWPSDREFSPRKKEEPNPWYETMDRFSCLAVDLGQREAGACALLDVRANHDFGKNKKGKHIPSRFIGQTNDKKWWAALAASGMFKLPGENASVFRPRTKPPKDKPSPDDRNEKDKNPGKDFREELWGESGRPALRKTDPGVLCDETEKARALLTQFDQMDIIPAGWDDPKSPMFLSFPEQNDKLIIAARRYLSRIRRLHRWCAFLNSKNWPKDPKMVEQKRRRALEEIREACGLDKNSAQNNGKKDDALQKGEAWLDSIQEYAVKDNDPRLADVLRKLLEPMLERLPQQMVDLANRCVPFRGRSWRWTEHAKSTSENPLHILLPTGRSIPNVRMKMPNGMDRGVTWIRGQRGLSMKRIGQLEDLRRLLQSLNQIKRRKIGTLPPSWKKGERGCELPDCCPKLLEKLGELKEQRVNQLAHQILAAALGLRLKKSGPTKPDEEREYSDIHGEYERIPDVSQPDGYRRPVDFVVLEDLKYYETTRMRSRKENVRLMRWCRRHFRDKLRQLCEVFGIPVVEANPAYTSRFCARTGIAGFRAVEVGPGFEQEYVWRKALEKLEKYQNGSKKLEPDDLDFCEGVKNLKEQVEAAQQIPTKSGKNLSCPRTLLAPLGSGNIFVPITDNPTGVDLPPTVVQADINAAINLGLRAIADPKRWEFHPCLRTKRQKEKEKGNKRTDEKSKTKTSSDTKTILESPKLTVAEKRKYGDRLIELDLTKVPKGAAIEGSRNPNYFHDLADLANELKNFSEESVESNKQFVKLLVEQDKIIVPDNVELLSSKAFWLAVKKLQWRRCLSRNSRRLEAWKNKAEKAAARP